MSDTEHCPRCGSIGYTLLLDPALRGCSLEQCQYVWVARDLAAAWPDLEDVPDIPDNETLSRLVCDAVIDWTLDEQGVDFSPLPKEE